MAKDEWQKVKLNELGFVGRGKSRHRPRNAAFLYGGLYPFFQTGDIKAAGLYLKEYTQTYSEEGLAQSKLWEPGTLCITIAANIAESAILGIKGCFPDSIVGFIADPQKADVRFIKYYIDTLKLEMQSISRGTTQDNLSLDKLLTIDFNIPPIPLQHRIADILSTYDDLIENCQQRVKILEDMARNLYREWFVRFHFPGHEQVKMVSSSLGEIPEGWEVKAFTEIADVLSGGTPKTIINKYWNGSIPFFTPRDAPADFYIIDTEKHITELGLSSCASELYPADTIFITARGTVGKVALPAIPMAMNQSCYALRGKNGLTQRYLFLLTLQQVDYLRTNTGGATFDTIVVDTFRRMQIVKPPINLIVNFTQHIDAMFEQVNLLQHKIQTLRRTRDLLLPRLMSGEIDIKER